MSDFLHNLRNGNVNNRYDRTRKNYDNPQYRNTDRHNRDKRNNYQRKPHTADQLGGIKKLIEEIGATQKELVAATKARIEVENRMADALEGILAYLGNRGSAPGDAAPEAEAVPVPAMGGIETAPVQSLPEATEAASDPVPETKPEAPADPMAGTLKIIREMRAQGTTYEKIARHLESTGAPTASGRGKWRGQAVSKLLAGD